MNSLALLAVLAVVILLTVFGIDEENNHLKQDTMDEKDVQLYTEEDLVSFGNYLLEQVRSWERVEKVKDPKLLHVVGHWDIANWKESMK